MPRSTAASKAAAGPLNTFKDEIINILTPQVELAAANAEIKQLWELLKARDTPIFNDKSSTNTLKLTMVLQALSQWLNGFIKTYAVPLWSVKVADPLLFMDGIDLTFNNWKL
jgi:hypothetical protein